MSTKPNIIFILTDQQRADTVNALGAHWMHTPHMDRLVREGFAFTNCFVTSPVCVASRASLFTGMYPHARGVFKNFQPWRPTWVQWLADADYHCVNIGKMHINPNDDPGGFHQRFVVENKDWPLFLDERDRAFYDEWDKALHAHKVSKPSRYLRYAADAEAYRKAMGAFVWDLPDGLHSDNFVGDHVLWWLEERKATNPLFLQIGFLGPHPPYDPTAEHLRRYASVDIPVADFTLAEEALQPRSQGVLRQNMITNNFDSIAWKYRPDSSELLRIRRHYAANVTMIDEKIGQIMATLERKGYLDNALVIFSSDHADALGDHGHIQKWTMYDSVERVPLVIWSPRRIRGGGRSDSLVQLMDVAPTLLDAAGVPTPGHWEARSLWPVLREERPSIRDVVYAELARDHIQTGAEYIVMRRDRDWKLVYYLDEPDGELFDLRADPDETRNLWFSAEHCKKRDELVHDLLDLVRREGERLNYSSNGPGTFPHLAAELYRQATGAKFTHIPYSGGPKAIVALITNEVGFSINNIPNVMGMVKSGKLRAIATTGRKRSPLFPDLPTFAEAGIAGFETSAWYALYAPAGTPEAVVKKLNLESAKALYLPDLREKLALQGDETVGGSPDDLAAYLKAEHSKWPAVINAANITAQ